MYIRLLYCERLSNVRRILTTKHFTEYVLDLPAGHSVPMANLDN